MEIEHIVLIVCGGLFAIAFLVYLFLYWRQYKKAEALSENLEKMYSDENLRKMEYDVGVYGEEAERFAVSVPDYVESADGDEEELDGVLPEDLIFGKMENEGLEEIKGSYKPLK